MLINCYVNTTIFSLLLNELNYNFTTNGELYIVGIQ